MMSKEMENKEILFFLELSTLMQYKQRSWVSGKSVKDLLESAWFWHQKALDFSPGESCEEVLWETLESRSFYKLSSLCQTQQ